MYRSVKKRFGKPGIMVVMAILLAIAVPSAYADIEIHPDERKPFLVLLKQMGISIDDIKEAPLSPSELAKQPNGKKNYFFLKNALHHIWFITDQDNAIVWLALAGNSLEDFSLITKFRKLRKLKIREEAFTNLKGIRNLQNLEEFTLTPTKKIRSLEEVHSMPKLKVFETSIHDIEDLGSMKGLPDLEVFSCRNCKIKSFDALSNLKNLKELRLSSYDNSVEALSDLTRLEYLNLDMINLKSIAPLSRLVNLEVLSLGHNKLRSMEAVSNLTSLNKLRIDFSEIENVTDLSGSKKLKDISIAHANLETIEGLGKLDNLERLNLYGNKKLVDISSVNQYKKLTYLNLTKTGITSLKGLSLPLLNELDLSYTGVTSFEGMGMMPSLLLLYMEGGQLSSLKGIENIPLLRSLQVDPEVMYHPDNREAIEKIRNRGLQL